MDVLLKARIAIPNPADASVYSAAFIEVNPIVSPKQIAVIMGRRCYLI